jgi:serine/threonine protein phosphatase PrpC
MPFRHTAVTDVGRRREHNEDSFVVDPDAGVFVVADGMGGHSAGETASRLTVERFHAVLTEPRSYEGARPDGVPAAALALARAVTDANDTVREQGDSDRSLSGMGTTVVALVARGTEMVVGHVGDSRAYLLRGGELRLLTEDHSLVQEEIRAGTLSPARARTVAYRNVITLAIGMDPELAPDVTSLVPAPGDRVLLCSDGLNSMLEDPEIGALLGSGSIEQAARSLVDAANEAGGDDNTTVVVVEWFE